MKIKVNKKALIFFIVIIFLLSALIYNILYINNKKNSIIEEINEFEIEENTKDVVEKLNTIFVDVGGEVVNPGLYELPENSRINDAINIAGGVADKADLADVNLAYVLSDAMKITVPKKELKKVNVNKGIKSTVTTTTNSISLSNSIKQSDNNLININIATKEQLMTLTGIGESIAQKIINYRNEKGNFQSIEDIKNVSGIGESKYEKIKEKIVV